MDRDIWNAASRIIQSLIQLDAHASTAETRIAIETLDLDDTLMKEAFAVLDSSPGQFFDTLRWHPKLRRLRNDTDELERLFGSDENDAPETQPESVVDIGMSWAGFGKLYRRLAETCEVDAIKQPVCREQLAKGMATADALCALQDSLTDAQLAVVAEALQHSLAQQGY